MHSFCASFPSKAPGLGNAVYFCSTMHVRSTQSLSFEYHYGVLLCTRYCHGKDSVVGILEFPTVSGCFLSRAVVACCEREESAYAFGKVAAQDSLFARTPRPQGWTEYRIVYGTLYSLPLLPPEYGLIALIEIWILRGPGEKGSVPSGTRSTR